MSFSSHNKDQLLNKKIKQRRRAFRKSGSQPERKHFLIRFPGGTFDESRRCSRPGQTARRLFEPVSCARSEFACAGEIVSKNSRFSASDERCFIFAIMMILQSFLIATQLNAQQKSPARLSPLEKLKSAIAFLQNDTDMAHASWGISVVQAKTGDIITEYNSNLSLAPASTQKVITTAAGLSILGPDYTYRTSLEYDGILDSTNGIIKGNLIIKGSGDPTIESFFFKDKNDTSSVVKKWAGILKTKGIKSIEGAIIADASVFEDETTESNWVWGDMGNYYGAGASGLTYMDDMYSIWFNSGKNGDTAGIAKITPFIPGFRITNYVTAAGTEDEAYIYGAPYSDAHYVNGTIPAHKTNFEVKGSLPDPPYLLAFNLKQELAQEGISIQGEATTVRQLKLNKAYKQSPRKILYTHTSPSLEKIVYWTNMTSNNLFAEHILKTIALKKQHFGTATSGLAELMKFWKSKGLDTKGMSLMDGCGMARANTVTPKQLTDIFCILTKDKAYTAFYNSLPVAGKTGTLKNSFKGTSAENRIHAKTGSFNRVRSFAGYGTTKNGEQIAFSLIANNFDCSNNEMRTKLERIVVLIAELD